MGDSFKDLLVWRRAIDLTLSIYRMTSHFPTEERYGLTAQLRRSAVSVASNIAEGYGRATTGEYISFLGHARGSVYEVMTQLTLAHELHLANKESCLAAEELATEVSKMLVAMIKKLKG